MAIGGFGFGVVVTQQRENKSRYRAIVKLKHRPAFGAGRRALALPKAEVGLHGGVMRAHNLSPKIKI